MFMLYFSYLLFICFYVYNSSCEQCSSKKFRWDYLMDNEELGFFNENMDFLVYVICRYLNEEVCV